MMFPSSSSSVPYPYFPPSSSSSSSSSSSTYYPPFFTTFLENASATNNFIGHDPHPLNSIPVPYNIFPSHPHPHPHPHHEGVLTNWADAMLKQDASGSGLITKKAVRKGAAKKDRHSKIHTAQGLRDRRVRLSIEIARKFFDLQDMLGFDKASNTLDWLFSKSNKAIKELTRKINTSISDVDGVASLSFSSSAEEEVISMEDNNSSQEIRQSKKKKKMLEKARARARERTTNKGTILPGSQIMIEEEANEQDFNVIEESIFIKRKLKQSSMSSTPPPPNNSHHHLVIPTPGGGHHYHSFNNDSSSPNWDPNPNNNFCTAIATMNLSTGLQIFGKSWEECTNPHL